MDILSLIESQNPWWREPSLRLARDRPVRRDLQPKVLERLGRADDRRALLLLGPRQVGKTALLEQTVDDLLEAGWPAANITYFDFSDDRLVDEVTARQVAETSPPGVDGAWPRVFLLDEISRSARWDAWLKQAVDRPVGRIVATDSAASILRQGGRESGQGRWDEMYLEGLTYREYVRLLRPSGPEGDPTAFRRYLAVGGFPEHALSDHLPEVRRRLRSDVVERAVLRDLAGSVEDPRRARDLFVYLVQESGGELVSTHRADDLDANRKTIERWVELLEETFLLARLDARREKASKRLRSRPKLYAADHGLVMAFAVSPDPVDDPDVQGKVFEAVVFRHLRELARNGAVQLNYLRTKDSLEADFVLDHPGGTVAIEVTRSRRAKAEKLAKLRAAAEVVGADRRVLIHGGWLEGPETGGEGEEVQLVPLMRFLAEPEVVLPPGGTG